MLNLPQRLVLGLVLLIALVAGLAFLVRASFVSLGELDARELRSARAVSALAVADGTLLREQWMLERTLAIAPGAEPQAARLRVELQRQAETARVALDAAAQAAQDVPNAPSLAAEQTMQVELARRFRAPLSLSERDAAARLLALLNRDLEIKLGQTRDHRARAMADIELEREGLRARLIGASGASILTAIAISVLTTAFVLAPMRKAARAARRMGQGELDRRLAWSMRDDLGVLATELNRMAVRLRDLRETESGRRQMELQLADAIVQSIYEPVIVTDARGQLLKVNQAARELLGSSAPDRMALANTPGGDRILSAIRTAISMQKPFAEEGEAAQLPMRIGASQRDFRLRTTPLRDAEGHLLGAVSLLEDVTEMQGLDRFKTRFLSIASQRLRTPLDKLRTAIHALARGYAGELRPLQADVVEGAREEAEHLDDLMSDLFAVAELEGGRRVLRIEQLQPLSLLREASEAARTSASEAGVTLEVEGWPDLPLVLGERRALRSVFDNLLSNAVRHTPRGGTVTLEAMEGKEHVRFTVRDTGRGIEPERLRNIFGRFAANGEGDGTGLGLALVQRLVQAQGGQISVESKVGSGSAFTFTLPLAPARQARHPVEVG